MYGLLRWLYWREWRLLGARMKQHKRAVCLGSSNDSAGARRVEEDDHSIKWECIEILDKEPSKYNKRNVKEAIHISQWRPALTRGGGYDLPPIYIPLIPLLQGATPGTAPGSGTQLPASINGAIKTGSCIVEASPSKLIPLQTLKLTSWLKQHITSCDSNDIIFEYRT